MKIPGKNHIVFPLLILLLIVALVFNKLMLPFSSGFLTVAFDAAAVYFFLRIFLVSQEEKESETLGFGINVLPVAFCTATISLLIRLNDWRGWHGGSTVALVMLVLIAIPTIAFVKKFSERNREQKLDYFFVFLVPWIFFIPLIALSFFSNPRQFHNFFNGTTYEQYVRQGYSQKEGTMLLEKFKPHDAKSVAGAADYFSKAKAAEAKEDYDEALRLYNKSIDLNPDDAEAIYWRGLLKLTWLELSKDMALEAINDFTRAIELKPEYARAYYHRAVANDYLTHGNNPEARKDFIKAASLDSTLKNDTYVQEAIKKNGSEKVGK